MAVLRALYDCGIVRASDSHAGFNEAHELGMVDYRVVPGSNRLDYFLTAEGREVTAFQFGEA